jgi:two-component system OmpR family response regulator
MRVLIIEDDQRLARLIEKVMQQEHYGVDLAHDGDTGLEFALTGAYSVAIVDWMVPIHDGPAICRAVRAMQLPLAILMLTARVQVEDRVQGLNSGADDYLIKPFAFAELVARVRALSRRYTKPNGDYAELRGGDIVMDVRSHTARQSGQPLHLTETEWNLLECFLRHPEQALTRKQIFDQVWGVNSDTQLSMVDVYISYLRHKLDPAHPTSGPIETVRGIGYRFHAH